MPKRRVTIPRGIDWLGFMLKTRPSTPQGETQRAHDIQAVEAMRALIEARRSAGFSATAGSWTLDRGR